MGEGSFLAFTASEVECRSVVKWCNRICTNHLRESDAGLHLGPRIPHHAHQ